MLLPSLDRLSLRTGEFYPLNEAEVEQFEIDEVEEPFMYEPFQLDGDGWRTFRVRINEPPRPDGKYRYYYYKATYLWRHYNKPTMQTDPQNRQPIWHEDWMALHEAYAPLDSVPPWVHVLPTLEVNTPDALPDLPDLLAVTDSDARSVMALQHAADHREDLSLWPDFATLLETYNKWIRRFKYESRQFDVDPGNSNRYALMRAFNEAEATGLDAYGVLNGGDVDEPNTSQASTFEDQMTQVTDWMEGLRLKHQQQWSHNYYQSGVDPDEDVRRFQSGGQMYGFDLDGSRQMMQEEWDNLLDPPEDYHASFESYYGSPAEHSELLADAHSNLEGVEDMIMEDMQLFLDGDENDPEGLWVRQGIARAFVQHRKLRSGLVALTTRPIWFEMNDRAKRAFLERFRSLGSY